MGFIIAYTKYAVFAVTLMYRRILDHKGRTNRQEFWWGFAYYFLIAIGGEVHILPDNTLALWRGVDFIYDLFMYLTIGALMMSVVRRLHDASRSGTAILVIILPVIGLFILLFLLILKSTDGPNKFGPEPKHWKSFAL